MSATPALIDSPGETWKHTLAKLCFFICCVLVAASLVLVSISLTGARNPASVGSTLRANIGRLNQELRDELLSTANAIDHLSNFVVRATNVHALIRPADFISTPVIPPTAQPTIAAATPPPAQPLATATTVTVPVAAPLPAGSNGYAWGNCTWWAAARRAQLGRPIPSSWGNAASWAVRAGRDGYRVDHSPSPGAIMQTPYSAGGLGHVAIVEQVDADGTWHISEMNVLGLNIVDHAARTAAAAAHYSFIH